MSKPAPSLYQLFEEQALRTPDAPALVFEQQRLTYDELRARAERLAGHLVDRGVGPDMAVGLLVERSLEMIVAVLATLKAGGAYLPIDPSNPRERIGFMLEDAGASVLLTQKSLLALAPDGIPDPLCVDTFDWTGNSVMASAPSQVAPSSLAYVIYTSGSTGQPKGVGIEHRNIVNYVHGVVERLRFEPGMRHATVSTLAADLGNTVIFPALVTGGCLHVIARERSESQAKLAEYFRRERIDVLKIVPSHLAALLSGGDARHVMPRRRLVLGGEPSRLDWIEGLRPLAPECEIFNHYGPTETTVGVLTYHVAGNLPATPTGTLPLGKPLPNTRAYILDEHGVQVARGEIGELCIGGVGVARGYLNRPELTAERFVADPFSPETGGRLYRTGDRARYLPDGNVEFCGRADDQVKIHGYRIELGEIERCLRSQAGIQDAVAIATGNASGNGQLQAFVVPKRAHQPLWDRQNLYLLPNGLTVAHLNRNETDYIYHEIFVLQAYLRHGITINDGTCIIDAGSNIGLFTVFASLLARDLRILAFEPNPTVFACLERNTEAWGNGTKCLPYGLSSQNRTAEMTFFEGLSLLSGFYADASVEREVVRNYVANQQAQGGEDFAQDIDELIAERMRGRTLATQLRTLSDVIAEHGIENIDLLKINVEKSELDVLTGLDEADWPKVRQMVIEVDQQKDVEPIKQMLTRHGFELLVEQDPLLRKTELCYVYAIRPSASGRLKPQTQPEEHVRPIVVPPEILSPASLRACLKAQLPPYMVPASFALLERIPLNANGKVDRQGLSARASAAPTSGGGTVLPRTETEKALAAIWADLLKLQAVGIDDDFFDLGGHSLMAIRAVSRIRDAFSVDLQTRVLFENPTVAALSKIIDAARESVGTVPAQRIGRRVDAGSCPLSFSQEQIWFLQQLAPASPAYNIVDFVRFDGPCDPPAVRRALSELVARHDVLRTVFKSSQGLPLQVILSEVAVELVERDIASLREPERRRAWTQLVHEQSRRPFDLSEPPLFRAALIRMSPQEHRLLLTIHHIVADEWSMEIVQREIKSLYEATSQGRTHSLAPLPIQYPDFAAWQRSELRADVLIEQLAYWKEELAGAETVLHLPTDKARPQTQSFGGATETFMLPGLLVAKLTALARQEHSTLFLVLEASFSAFLHRYSGQTDFLVGTPITHRTQSETEGLIGLFLNTLVLRARINGGLSFRSLLRQTHERALGAFAHAELPFNRLAAEFATERDPGRTPLFQAMFVMHDVNGVSQVSKVSGNNELETGTSKFDLSLMLSEAPGGLEGLFEYSTDLFEAATVKRMCGHFVTLLRGISANPDELVSRLPMLSDRERSELQRWNSTTAPYPTGRNVAQLVQAQALRTPDRVALRSGELACTYRELDERSDRLARVLRSRGAARGALIGLSVERGVAMVVAQLAVLKSGAGYVPLDPAYPTERLSAMAQDARIALLITDSASAAALPWPTGRLIVLDAAALDMQAQSSDPLPADAERDARPEDVAYVIYTSGSTGKPKGVCVPHRAAVNFLVSMAREPGLTATDRLLAVTTLSFDIAVLELLLPLTVGAEVVIANREQLLDGRALRALVESSGANVMQATPSGWRTLIDAGWLGGTAFKALIGGETLPTDLAMQLRDRTGELWNMYGPTETTVWSTCWKVEHPDLRISVGRPIANTTVWIVDESLQACPIGIPGEVCIGGDGVALGYLGRDDLTAERFIADPYGAAPAARLYRTGDRGRWRDDGLLEHMGRLDFQVKVRGFRIEPGEIETRLAAIAGVRSAVVVAREFRAGDTRLVAYLVCDGRMPDESELRAGLRRSLPDYMVPQHFIQLDAFPLQPNGKLDRRALPMPELARDPAVAPPQATMTPSEEAIARVWREVLGVSSVLASDNFFDLGGHSMLSMRAIALIEQSTGRRIAPRRFVLETLSQLADALDDETSSIEAGAAKRRPETGLLGRLFQRLGAG